MSTSPSNVPARVGRRVIAVAAVPGARRAEKEKEKEKRERESPEC